MYLLKKVLLIILLKTVVADNSTFIAKLNQKVAQFSPRIAFFDLIRSASTCSKEVISTQRNGTTNDTTAQQPSIGNCTNNLTNPSTITSTSSPTIETASDEPKQPIVTFDEWTKEKLKQEQRKVVTVAVSPPPSVDPPTPTRNYASRECGAKVLLSNSEAENTKAILNDKEKDEYMRNPCIKADNKYIVLELCETVQPRQIVLGNFELFSSGPKNFRILAAERTGAEWQSLGNFTAADTRQLQTFTIETRQYAKLLKIELTSHYGNEHYCTLSVLKVMGSSMVDEYEFEANQAESVRLPLQIDETNTMGNTNIKSPVIVEPVTPELPKPTLETPSTHLVAPLPKMEQKPIVREIVDQVVSGKLLNNIVNVVANKLSGDKKMNSEKKYKPFDISLCKVCPVNSSCMVPTHLCWVFIWKPAPRNLTAHIDRLFPIPNRRLFSERRRRRHISFHQRQMHKHRDSTSRTKISSITTITPTVIDSTASSEDVKNDESITPTPAIVQSVDAVPAASVSHKESVFMKLNKRIAALELNMSLSSEYLSELSRQYVAQTDEHKKHLEQARKTAQKIAEGIELRLNKTIAERLSMMREEMESLTQWLHAIRKSASYLSLPRFIWPAPGKDSCRDEDTTAMKHYDYKYEKSITERLWTTEELIFIVVCGQIFTVLILGGLFTFACSKRHPALSRADVKAIIKTEIYNMSEKTEQDPVMPNNSLSVIPVQKKKRRKRNRPSGLNYASSDSAVSRTTTCPTETSSEAESARLAAQQEADTTLRPHSSEKSEEEDQPWIPVRYS